LSPLYLCPNSKANRKSPAAISLQDWLASVFLRFRTLLGWSTEKQNPGQKSLDHVVEMAHLDARLILLPRKLLANCLRNMEIVLESQKSVGKGICAFKTIVEAEILLYFFKPIQVRINLSIAKLSFFRSGKNEL